MGKKKDFKENKAKSANRERIIKDHEDVFVLNSLEELYIQQKNRGEAIQNQLSRLLVFQTLYFTAFYTILPTLLKYYVSIENSIWTFTAATSVLGLMSIICTVLSQRKIKSDTVVTIKNLHKFVNEHSNNSIYEVNKMAIRYKKQYIENQLEKLIQRNEKRSKWLERAIGLFVLIILVTVIFIFCLIYVGR